MQKFCMAWKSWTQKFCTTLFSAQFTTFPTTTIWCRNSAWLEKGWMQKFCTTLFSAQFTTFPTTTVWCRNSAWLEKGWMQKFCTTLFSAQFTTFPTTTIWCRNSAWLEKVGCRNSARPYFPLNSLLFQQRLYDAEILHGLKKLDAEILHDHIFLLIHYFLTRECAHAHERVIAIMVFSLGRLVRSVVNFRACAVNEF